MPDVGGIAGDRLRAFIERIERLHEERKAFAGDIAEVFAEAKGTGFNAKVMRQVLAIRRMGEDDRDEQDALLDTYLRAIGMKSGTRIATRVPAREDARPRARTGTPGEAVPAPKVVPEADAPAAQDFDGVAEIEISEETPLTHAVRQELLANGFVEIAPGRLRPPLAQSVLEKLADPRPPIGEPDAAPAPVGDPPDSEPAPPAPPPLEDTDRAYDAGYRARGTAAAIGDNPHAASHDPLSLFNYWRQGWRDADDEGTAMLSVPTRSAAEIAEVF